MNGYWVRGVLYALGALLLFSEDGAAQSPPCISPADSVQTFAANVYIPSSSSTKATTAIWDVTVMRSAQGNLSLVINAASIRFAGFNEGIDETSTPEFFGIAAEASVRQAVSMGLIPCTEPCDQPRIVPVSVPACVERIGMGTSTQFSPCGSGCCVRTYSVCCSNGTPHVTYVGSSSAECDNVPPTCEPTCSDPP